MIVSILPRSFKRLSQPTRRAAAIALLSVVCLPPWAPVAADSPPPTSTRGAASSPSFGSQPLPRRQTEANLDGLYLLLGVAGAAARIESEWDSAIGARISLFSFAEDRALTLWGLDAGLGQYGARDGGRAHLALVAGSERLGALAGLSAGLAAQWDPVEPPRLGAVATLWVFAGIVPTLSVGTFEHTGPFVELGARLTLPIARFTRTAL